MTDAAVWAFDWLIGMKGALPKDLISEQSFPKVFSWIKRFNEAVAAANTKGPKTTTLSGTDAAQRIKNAKYADSESEVDSSDPLALQRGDEVDVNPIDSGFSHKDRGSLISLTPDEVVIEHQDGIRLHFPRTGFRIKKAAAASGSRL